MAAWLFAVSQDRIGIHPASGGDAGPKRKAAASADDPPFPWRIGTFAPRSPRFAPFRSAHKFV